MKLSASNPIIQALVAGAWTVQANPTLFMTEIADPNDVYSGRFVEIYSPDGAGQVIGQQDGLDLYLTLTSNQNTDYNAQVKLTGETIGDDGFLIVCSNQATFATYGETCDVVSGSVANSNGDDAYTLLYTASPDGVFANAVILDSFGVPGLDPSGGDDCACNFQDGSGVRKADAPKAPDAVWDKTHWDVTNDFSSGPYFGVKNMADMTPRQWDGVGGAPTPTAPTPTVSPTPTPCVTIEDVQGSSDESPLVNNQVKVCGGFVTSIVRNGFYIQDPSPDADEMTSCGVFVYTGSDDLSSIAVGDGLTVFGTVSEYYGNTQVSASSYPKVGTSNVIAPTVLNLPVVDFERYEGMYVSIEPENDDSKIVISEYYEFDRYGDVKVCNAIDRVYQYTETNPPSVAGFAAHEELLAKSCVTIDDNNGSQNPNPALFGGIYAVTGTADTFKGGDEISALIGPLFYSFSKWRVQPMTASELQSISTPDKSLPSLGAGDLKIAVTNVLNYFTTFQERGAYNQEEFDRQSAKTTLALSMINADIYAICEVENVVGNGAVADLVSKLNVASSRIYEAVSTTESIDLIGSDAIKNDILYDTAKYNLLGTAVLTDDEVRSDLLSQSTTGAIFNGYSRQPLAATFEDIASNNQFTVVVNHFKSKGDRNNVAVGLDDDQNDGAGNYNHIRYLSSKALKEWLVERPTGFQTGNIIVTGDLNAYANEEPALEWTRDVMGQYYNAVDKDAVSPRPYSFLFDAQVGSLDYAFIHGASTTSMNVTDSAIWNVNSDYPDLLDYKTSYGRDKTIFDAGVPYRFSDHDPIILSLSFIAEPATAAPSTAAPTENCSDRTDSFQYKDGGRDKRWCIWLSNKVPPANVARECRKKSLTDHCPVSCEKPVCFPCSDRKDSFQYKDGGRDKRWCIWLSNKVPPANVARQCRKKSLTDHCPVSCAKLECL